MIMASTLGAFHMGLGFGLRSGVLNNRNKYIGYYDLGNDSKDFFGNASYLEFCISPFFKLKNNGSWGFSFGYIQSTPYSSLVNRLWFQIPIHSKHADRK